MKTMTVGLLTFAVACLAVPAFAQTSAREYSLEIERQPIADALIEFSQQTGLQIGYFPENQNLSKNTLVGPLSGRYTADAAMSHLLLPSGFSFERLNERTIAVTGPESTKAQPRGFLATERQADARSEHSFRRVADVRLGGAAAATGQNDVQERGAAEKPVALEEVIVTAQKREERLQDVPISISVLGGDELDRSTVAEVAEVLTRVPGVSISKTPVGDGGMVAVRGVATHPVEGGAPTTAYYLDMLPFSFVRTAFGPDPDAYDLERVEVLRGPQGTLYGANALNGVVRVLTNDANLDKFELKARASTSNTESGRWNYRGDMAVNVPIIDRKLAARAVLGYQDWGGWIDKPHKKDVNDAERRNLRLKIKAQPTEQLSIGVSGWFSRHDYGAMTAGETSGRNSVPSDEPGSVDFDAYGLKIGYEFPRFSITSMTSYIDYANHGLLDLSFLGVPAFDEVVIKANTFAQEVNLTSTHGGSWRWTLGGMYRDGDDRQIESLGDLLPAPFAVRYISKSYAVFGELTRIFFDGQLELTGGLRYFEDDVDMREESRFTGEPPEQLINANSRFNATTPRLVLTWYPGEQMTVYASYSEGFRSGADQSPVVLAVVPFPAVEPDTLTNYEVGAKGSLLGGRLNFDTALYYIDWQNLQEIRIVSFRGTPFAGIINGDSASGFGVDFGVTTRPFGALELGVNVNWNDLAFDSDVLSGGLVLAEKGDRPDYSTKFTAGASADYVFPIGRNGLEGQFSASANYTSPIVTRGVTAGEVTRSDAILIARTSISIRAADRWIAALFVDNVNNERGSPRKHPVAPPWSVRVLPRTTGLQLEYRF